MMEFIANLFIVALRRFLVASNYRDNLMRARNDTLPIEYYSPPPA
jgi:hypothetical protein